jgi:hypothetical protein
MFGSLALLSGIALFSSVVALPAAPSITATSSVTNTPSVTSAPSVAATPQIFQVLVGSLQGDTIYTPPYVVSQVLAAQPNLHTNTLPFRTRRTGLR